MRLDTQNGEYNEKIETSDGGNSQREKGNRPIDPTPLNTHAITRPETGPVDPTVVSTDLPTVTAEREAVSNETKGQINKTVETREQVEGLNAAEKRTLDSWRDVISSQMEAAINILRGELEDEQLTPDERQERTLLLAFLEEDSGFGRNNAEFLYATFIIKFCNESGNRLRSVPAVDYELFLRYLRELAKISRDQISTHEYFAETARRLQ